MMFSGSPQGNCKSRTVCRFTRYGHALWADVGKDVRRTERAIWDVVVNALVLKGF